MQTENTSKECRSFTPKRQFCQICLSFQCLNQWPCSFESKSTTCDQIQFCHPRFNCDSTQQCSWLGKPSSINPLFAFNASHNTFTPSSPISLTIWWSFCEKKLWNSMLKLSHNQARVSLLDVVSVPHSMFWLLQVQTDFLFAQNNHEIDLPWSQWYELNCLLCFTL